jgi:hypothetical protein
MNRFISSITLDSFAGRTRRHDFQPGVTAIIGANGTGKTTIANAVAFVLSGKVPGLPKTNGGIMDALGSTLRMGATVTIGDATYDRALIRSGKSIKGEAKHPAPADLLPPSMLDLEPFLAATPKGRASMILGACGASVPSLLEALLKETGLERFVSAGTEALDDAQDILAKVDEAAKKQASGYTASIKDMRGTLSGMEVLDTSPLASPAGRPLAELRAEVNRMERELSGILGEARAIASRPAPVQPAGDRPNGSAEAFERQLAEAQRTLATARADLAQAQADRRAWDHWQAERARLEAKVAEAQQAYQAVSDGWEPVDVDKLNEELQNHSLKAAQARAKIDEAKKDVLTDKDVCPCCGAKAEYWNREASDKHDLAAWERDVTASTKRMEEIRATLNQAAAVSRASDAVLRATAALEAQQPAEATRYDVDTCQAAVDEATESCDMLTAEARKARAWDAYEAASKTAEQDAVRMAQLNMTQDNLQAAICVASAALRHAEVREAAENERKAREATRQQAADRLAELEAEEAEFKAARQAWQDGVHRIMDEALRDVLKVCETFTAGLFASPLTVHDLELGRYEGTAWVPLDAFCGSDKRVAVAAVQAALASNHKGFRLVILDEFGTIDPARKPAVLANLAAAVQAGLVDQAWVMDNRAIDDMPAEVNEIRLELNT